MSSILVINAAGRETRVALVENGHIAEFYLERKKDKGIVGNIYKGRVVRVLPGMQAAFVEIGQEKAAFLYVTDVYYDPDLSRAQYELTEGEHEHDVPEVPEVEHENDAPADEEAVTAEPEAQASEATANPVAAATEAADETPSGPSESPTVAAEQQPSAQSADASPFGGEDINLAIAEEPSADSAASLESPDSEAERPEGAPGQGGKGASGGRGGRNGERRAPNSGQKARRSREEESPRRSSSAASATSGRSAKTARIENLLKVGQEVLVQISKDPIGTKGARLTCHISIPGRHLVFMPTVDHVGISRRISNEKERRRLREIVDRLRPPGTGFIVRTVAENVPSEKLESDIRFLIEVWNQTVRRNERRNSPGLLHPDLDLILRATRDLFAKDVEKLVVDDRDEYERVLNFVSAQDPAMRERIVLHDNEEPVFDAYGIEQELHRAVQRKVWLKSGGYLIIDQAEALTAIDVNSGRYVGKKSLEETITKINTEAAKEIVYQLRLRNIGGIIICDFIDMEKQSNREKVFKTLQEALGRDKAKTNVLRISELGLVEMTRKRVRESIGRILHQDCAYCDGKGFVKTPTTVCYEIFREIRRESATYKDPALVINCHAEVAKLLSGEERQELRHLMDRYNKSIQVTIQGHYHQEQYDIYGRSAASSEKPENTGPGLRSYGERERSSERQEAKPPQRG